MASCGTRLAKWLLRTRRRSTPRSTQNEHEPDRMAQRLCGCLERARERCSRPTPHAGSVLLLVQAPSPRGSRRGCQAALRRSTGLTEPRTKGCLDWTLTRPQQLSELLAFFCQINFVELPLAARAVLLGRLGGVEP